MARYNRGWAPYVPVAERRRRATREMDKLRKMGQPVSPVVIEGRSIATTFWGKSWCDNLESYRDYENRLPRGRTYVRNGSVLDLQTVPLEIRAMVSGSEIYKVTVTIKALAPALWRAICRDCSGGIDTLVDLLQGRFSKPVMERLCRQDGGLFPKPSEIRFSCSCPDAASMCKHVAAVLYGVGARLDHQPELLFRLRSVDENDLLPSLEAMATATAPQPDEGRVLEGDDLSALFGLDMAVDQMGAEPDTSGPTASPPFGNPSEAKKVTARKSTATRAGRRKTPEPSPAPADSVELTEDGYVKWWK